MRVVLALPASLAGVVEVGDLVPFPFEPDPWHRRELGTFEPIERHQLETASGWPLIVYRAVAPDQQTKIAGFYKFFDYGACVRVRGQALSDEVMQVLRSAEPDWSAGGQVVCLAELLAS